MTRDDIIRMAREAWGLHFICESDVTKLERFAEIVAAAEREACAEICDRFMSAENCALVIRARSNTHG